MEKILLTGGTGFFASRFAERFKDQYNILSPDIEELDITDEKKVFELFKKERPNYVIHAAAIAVTDFCNKHPEKAHKINVEGAINVGKACKEVGAKLVFISSEQVFNGNPEEGPYNEEHKAIPDTVYGQNKLEAEGLLKEILDELWVVRFTWLMGMPDKKRNIASNIIWETVTSLLKGEKIYASQREFRGMTYVDEMLENVNKLFKIPYGTYHLGSENNLSRYEVVKHILKEMGLENRIDEVLVEDVEKYKDAPRDVRLDTSKAKENGLVFSTTIEGINQCLKDYSLILKK
ncbi:sugar nucleotide-binding protein [Clostridium sp. YIM B02551]|uniref:SDR family oxidoreductase n=1 Tax=Clostridium sp. YIM B02551 TaxID=2910679 RepID=UPI001EEA2879|nr:sugar nucleotide-binding protein [Clostridium sp. YIM B02551]